MNHNLDSEKTIRKIFNLKEFFFFFGLSIQDFFVVLESVLELDLCRQVWPQDHIDPPDSAS